MADASPQTPQRLPIAQTLYTTYLDEYQRRLRKGVTGPLSDAAGLVNGTRYHGRPTPRKGAGQPPKDDNCQVFVSGKHMVPGRSFVSTSNELLVHHALPPDEARSLRTSRVVAPCSYSSHLAGGGISVTSAERVYKPSKRPDTASKSINTHTRIFVDASGAAPAGGQVLMTFFGSARTDPFSCRPTTAPPCLVQARGPRNTQAARTYEEHRAGHADVLRYRHSGGICPDEYKLCAERPAAPQLSSPGAPDARACYFDARSSYDVNRCRSLWEGSVIA